MDPQRPAEAPRAAAAAVQILSNHVLPFFEEHEVKIETILSDNGREFCGREDQHPYELFLQLEETSTGRPRWAVRSRTASSSASTARSWTSTGG